jgi:Uma2 family endonuclease
MSAVASKLITAEEFARMPEPHDGTLLELVRGEVVEVSRPKPRHGHICSKIDRRLGIFVEQHNLGWILVNDTGVIVERDPDTVRGPDLCFYSLERMPTIPETYSECAPELAVEVLSPDDRMTDVREKVREYLAAGVKLVWVVDPDTKSLMVYTGTLRGKEYSGLDTIDGGDVLPGFTIRVSEFFS